MWGYGVEYNGSTEKENHMLVVKRPNIPTAKKRYQTTTVPGVDGQLYIPEDVIEDIEISIEFNFMDEPDKWFERFRAAKRWLYGEGSRELIFGDDSEFYYHVKNVVIEQTERVCYEIGKFTAVFTCSGWQYLIAGKEACPPDAVKYNPYDIARPIYHIAGNTAGTLTVNGNSMSVNVGQNLIIDTEKRIAYKASGQMMNASISGDYDDMVLKPGDNTISITNGLILMVSPRWRCI